jgi:hypothetical protein
MARDESHAPVEGDVRPCPLAPGRRAGYILSRMNTDNTGTVLDVEPGTDSAMTDAIETLLDQSVDA